MTWLQGLLDWVHANPALAWALVFISAWFDSLFVIGVVLPGAVAMFSIGALIALGAFDFWTCLAVCIAGAIFGDAVNYFLGRVFRDRLFNWRLIRERPALIEGGQAFFRRHGGKSILLGRFIGPLRPIVPAIAGVYGLRPAVFFFTATIAAIGWTFLYVVPGVVFGASLALAAEVATRLAVLLVAVLVLLFVLVWGVRIAINVVQAHAEEWLGAMLDWSHRHRRVGRLGSWLADPDQPETPALLLLAVVLLIGSGLWAFLWWGGATPQVPAVDTLAFQGLRGLHTPAALWVATAVAMLGDWQVFVPVSVMTLASLLFLRRSRAAWHWAAAIGLASLIALGLWWLQPLPRPVDLLHGDGHGARGGHGLVIATVVYGFLSVVLTTRRLALARSILYGSIVSLVALIVLSQMYVGRQWMSAAVSALVTGTLWILVLGIGFRRHGARWIPLRPFLVPVAGVFVLAAALHWRAHFEDAYASLQSRPPAAAVGAAAWWDGRYADLPAFQMDLAGVPRRPMNLQWAGDLDSIRGALVRAGWSAPLKAGWESSLRWLSDSPIDGLPVLPQRHAGDLPTLVLRRGVDADAQWLLRLWPANARTDGTLLWIGTVSRQARQSLMRWVNYPQTLADADAPFIALQPPPPGFQVRAVRHPGAQGLSESTWSGRVFLLRPQDPPGRP